MVKRKKAKKAKKATKRKAKKGSKKAFGGYTVNFRGCDDTLEQVLGRTPIPPSQMTKKLWAYVKRNRLSTK
jgi:chromatin remodeling complex protein RSC6